MLRLPPTGPPLTRPALGADAVTVSEGPAEAGGAPGPAPGPDEVETIEAVTPEAGRLVPVAGADPAPAEAKA